MIDNKESMTTSAREAIRIAEAYLPGASDTRKMALAREIVEAINLCERELGDEIIRRAEAIARRKKQ